MLVPASILRALESRFLRLGLWPPSVAENELGVELAGIRCRVLLLPSGARCRSVVDELRHQGRLALAAHYRIEETAMDVVIHAPAATAPRGAMRKFLDVLWRGVELDGGAHA